jgi:hypothetical protein
LVVKLKLDKDKVSQNNSHELKKLFKRKSHKILVLNKFKPIVQTTTLNKRLCNNKKVRKYKENIIHEFLKQIKAIMCFTTLVNSNNLNASTI